MTFKGVDMLVVFADILQLTGLSSILVRQGYRNIRAANVFSPFLDYCTFNLPTRKH